MQHSCDSPPPERRIASVTLDDGAVIRRAPEVAHEREVALRDLTAVGNLAPVSGLSGPYELRLSVREQRLACALRGADGGAETLSVPLAPLRGVIKDYFLMCENYYAAIAGGVTHRVQTLDMARRATHNEGAELLARELARKATLDTATARALFTLVCVLHLK